MEVQERFIYRQTNNTIASGKSRIILQARAIQGTNRVSEV